VNSDTMPLRVKCVVLASHGALMATKGGWAQGNEPSVDSRAWGASVWRCDHGWGGYVCPPLLG
jgi:hypothetical protein